MSDKKIFLITGSRKGIGKYLVDYYRKLDFEIVGCSRNPEDQVKAGYKHYCVDVTKEEEVLYLFDEINQRYGRLDILLNNAGVSSMNHALLTPLSTVARIFETNVFGTFLFCREAAKLMKRNSFGRIVNVTSVATPLKLEGEAVYAASKAAVISLTEVLAREFAEMKITVNAIGPTPIDTDLIRAVPEKKIDMLVKRQAIKRKGTFGDVANVIDFFISPKSDFITGQVIFLGGV